jgi:hypothetical protein
MPNAKCPESPEWYVYQFEVKGVPFYVGIGRAERASDRLRWVCSQIKRELEGRPAKWVLHTLVLKAFILSPETIECRYIRKRVCRTEALRIEKQRIERLLESGHILANIQYNPIRPTLQQVVNFVRKKSK